MRLPFSRFSTQLRGVLGAFAWSMVIVSALPIALLVVLFVFFRPYCDTENLQTISNLSGVNIKIIDTYCDGPAYSVFLASQDGSHKTEIFKYEPDNSDVLPDIEVNRRENIIMISLERLDFIYFKKDSWSGMKVDYRIGKILAPQDAP